MENSEFGWADLPLPLLEQIFEILPIKYKGRAAQACFSWYCALKSDRCWRYFQYKDDIFVRRKFTQHSGWQNHIDHYRIRFLTAKVVTKWHRFEVIPVANLSNMYEFLRTISNFSEYYERNAGEEPLSGLRSFRFHWEMLIQKAALNQFNRDESSRQEDQNEKHKPDEVRDIGTGGTMLEGIWFFLQHLYGLKIWLFFNEKLEEFYLLNATLYRKSIMYLGLFLNLRKLVVSPQHIDDDSLILIGDLQYLKTFMLVQTEKTSEERSCSRQAWEKFKESNRKRTKLYLVLSGRCKKEMLIQMGAPVHSIIWENYIGQLTKDLAQQIYSEYFETLTEFIQKGLERKKRENKFSERADIPAVEIMNHCTQLQYFALRERISTATALILALKAKEMCCKLCIRQNALLKRNCWPSTDFIFYGIKVSRKWILNICFDYDLTAEKILEITRDTRCIMNDQQYKSFI
ncbi:unnamed protein product, partial [Mesorhabditis belari]|uniref:F-box domain-containing protein n=1 Tax=Mesorhabditis belari TaxID=2138241 RepID=A0AAF3EUG1_9BILA